MEGYMAFTESAGTHKLTFKTTNQIILSNLRVIRNYVNNGDFQTPPLGLNFNSFTNDIVGWIRTGSFNGLHG